MSLYNELREAYPELDFVVDDWSGYIRYVTVSKDDEVLLEIDADDYRHSWGVEGKIREIVDSHRAGLKAYCRVQALEKEVAELRELVQALLYAPGSAEYEKARANFESKI